MNKKNPRTIKFKSVAISFVLLSAVFVVALNYAFSQAYIEDVPEPSLTQPFSEASYVIGQYNSSHYYAKNWTGYGTSANKGYEWLDTDPFKIINYAISNTSNVGGGVVQLMADRFTANGTNLIEMMNNVVLKGMGMYQTKLVANASQTTSVIRNEHYTGEIRDHNFTVCELGIIGHKSSQSTVPAIEVQGVEDVTFFHLYIEGFMRWAFRVLADTNDNYRVMIDSCRGYWLYYNLMIFGGMYHAGTQTTYHTYDSTVTNCYVEYADTGYALYNAVNCKIINNYAVNCTNYNNNIGIAIEGDSNENATCYGNLIANNVLVGGKYGIEGTDDRYQFHNKITGNVCINNTYAGIRVGGGTNNYYQIIDNQVIGNGTHPSNSGIASTCNNTLISNNFVYSCPYGIRMVLGGTNSSITDNHLGGAFTQAIRIEEEADDVRIRENWIETGSTNDIYIESGAVNTIVEHNYLGSGSISDAGTNTVIRYNQGYTTENEGLATDKANGDTIAHGLEGTPDFVQLTCLNSTYDSVAVLVYWDHVNSDATNISLDVYWTNGTAITDAVIAVSWNAKYKP